jgi:Glutaminase
MDQPLSLTLFDFSLSDSLDHLIPSDTETIQQVFSFVAAQPIFGWQRQHNFCEARAEALSLLLKAAHIPHAKCWVFGAAFLHKGYVGGLKNFWNYHVAVAIPVGDHEITHWLVIDPATASAPVVLEQWAAGVTEYPHSYHCLRKPTDYIFPVGNMNVLRWHKRHHRNFRWAMQGLSGINALNPVGKAQLAFSKKATDKTTFAFMQLRNVVQAIDWMKS